MTDDKPAHLGHISGCADDPDKRRRLTPAMPSIVMLSNRLQTHNRR
jgi:hypothetical protein